MRVMDRLSKNVLLEIVFAFIRDCTTWHGKAKLVLKNNKLYVENEDHDVLRELLRDTKISQARMEEDETSAEGPAGGKEKYCFVVTTTLAVLA